MPVGGRYASARAVVNQFELAKADVLANTMTAHVWAPILQSMGPSLLVDARNALQYGEDMVAGWLAKYMFAGDANRDITGRQVAEYFNNADIHMNHGRRIGAVEAYGQGVIIDNLEDDQTLQEAVLTAYHVMTLSFERSLTVKLVASHLSGGRWVKSWATPEEQAAQAAAERAERAAPRPAAPRPAKKPARGNGGGRRNR